MNSLELDKSLTLINGNPELHANIHAGDELTYEFEITNTGAGKLVEVKVTDPLTGFNMHPGGNGDFVAYEQPLSIPGDGNLGPFSSVDRELASDPFEAKAWDNFSLSSDIVLDAVSWYGAYAEPFATGPGAAVPQTDFVIEIFQDQGGVPGSIVHSFHVPGGDAGVTDDLLRSDLLSHTTALGGPSYYYYADVHALDIPAGDYWLSITAHQTFPSPTLVDPTWLWHLGTNPGGADGFKYFDDTFDDPGDHDNGLVDTTPRPAVTDAKDLAFAIHTEFGGMLLPGESVVHSGTYVVTSEDVAAGEIVNTATASGITTAWRKVTDQDTEVVKIDNAMPGIDLDKYLWDINGSPVLHEHINAGDELIYSFDVTNTGDTQLTNVAVSDPLPGLVFDSQVVSPFTAYEQTILIPADGNLGPFSSIDRTLASDPEEAKAWDNFSLAASTVIDGLSWSGAYLEPFAAGLVPETDFLVEIYNEVAGKPGSLLHAFPLPGGDAGIDDALVKTTRLAHSAQAGGDVFQYEAMLPFTTLSPGDYWISITAQQTFPNPAPVIDPTWQWHLGTKSGGADGFYFFDDTFDDAGDNGVGANDQPATPANFEATKDLAFKLHGAELIDFDGSLDPGEKVMFMATYIVTHDDVATGEIVNTATATADAPSGPVSDSDTEVVPIARPGQFVDIDKFLWDINGSPNLHHNLVPGDELIYSFNVTNTGTQKLSGVTVTDPLPGIVIDDQVAVGYIAYDQPLFIPLDSNLGPFASTDRTLASDPEEAKAWDNFSLHEWTVIEGLSWAGAYVEPFATGAGVLIPETDFLIEIFADASGLPDSSPVLSFHVSGGQAGIDDANVRTTLLLHSAKDGGPVYEYHAMLPFTALDAGDYWLSVTALQTFPNGAPTIDPTWQWHLGTNPHGADGHYGFDDTFDDPGDNDIGLVDTVPRPAKFEAKDLAFTLHAARQVDFDGMLDPGEMVMFMGTYVVTRADVEAGEIVNEATVTGTLPNGRQVSDSDQFTFEIEYVDQCVPGMGDINEDGIVGFADFLLLAENFNKYGANLDGDLNCDGFVGFGDFLTLAENYEEEVIPPTQVAPTTVSISPSTPTVAVGTEIVLTSTFADENGAADLRLAEIRVSDTFTSVPRCLVRYDQKTNMLKLFDGSMFVDAGNPGSGTPVSNSECTLNPAASSVTVVDSEKIDVAIALMFSASMEGDWNLWLRAFDNNGEWSSQDDRGDITIEIA